MKILSCTLIVVVLLGATNARALTHPDVPPNRKIDSYGDISFRGEKVRLDALVAALRKEPHSQGYIMVYAGKRARLGEAAARGARAKEYLVKKRGIDARQVVVIDGGYREELTVELFTVPSGGIPPLATPTFDPNKVQIIGGRAKGRKVRAKS